MRALALALLVTGCAHQYGGRATVLDEGKAQLTPAVELSLTGAIPWLQLGAGYHQGLGHRVELGARAFGAGMPKVGGQFGVAADLKVQLFSSDDREHGWDIAVALSPSYHFAVQGDQPFHLFGWSVPILFGKNLGRHQLVLGLRFSDYVLTSYGQRAVNTFWVGTSIGFGLRVRRVQLMPELSVAYSPIHFGGEQAAEKQNGVLAFTAGLSLPIDLN